MSTRGETVKLYIGDYNLSSWSLRPWLALTHAQIPFTTEVIRLDRPETTAAIARVSPTARVPVLHVPTSRDPLVIWDSLAICEYAAEMAPAAALWPGDPHARAVARSVSCEMHTSFAHLRSQHPMRFAEHIPKAPSPEVEREIARILALWRELRGRYQADGPWLFGRFSIADAMFAPVCARIRTYDLPADAAAAAYLETMFAHPAVREWEQRARAEIAR